MLQSATDIADLIYLETSHRLRSGHRNAFVALGINIMQAMIMLAVFYIMFAVLGLRGAKIRGDFLVYLMTGIMMFMTNVKTVNAVSGSSSITTAMLKHAPMKPIIMIASAALSALYIQVLSIFLMMFVYHILVTPFEIDQPVMAFMMLLLAWFYGIGIGLILLALSPWFPGFVQIFRVIYMRANMIASGKMFVANSLPASLLAMFDWNPLFHIIDQCRGFAFINYFPRNSSLEYPIIVSVVLIVLGMMGEF